MTTYAPAAGDKVISGSSPATELASHVGGFIAGCGEAALAVVLHLSRGESTSPQEVTGLIRQAVTGQQTVGAKAESGQVSPSNLEWLASQHGTSLKSIAPGDIGKHAGHDPVIVGVSNAAAFGGTDSGVQGHYVTVVGVTHDGNYIVSDPNTPESTNGQYVTYTPQQMQQAQPFWAAVPTQTLADQTGGSTSSSSGCVHAINGPAGISICLDAGLELLIRGALIVGGAVLILAAIFIFAAGNEGVRSEVGNVQQGALKAAEVAAV